MKLGIRHIVLQLAIVMVAQIVVAEDRVLVHIESFKMKSGLIESLILKTKSTSTVLRKAVAKLPKGDSTIHDCHILVAKQGETCELSSIWQHLYPTEYDPPCIACGGQGVIPVDRPVRLSDLYSTPTAFEEVPVGSEVSVTPVVRQIYIGEEVSAEQLFDAPEDDEEDYIQRIDLYFSVKNIGVVSFTSHFKMQMKTGANNVTLTDFWRQSIENKVRLSNNESKLLGYTPAILPNGKKDPSHSIVTFVRASLRQ